MPFIIQLANGRSIIGRAGEWKYSNPQFGMGESKFDSIVRAYASSFAGRMTPYDLAHACDRDGLTIVDFASENPGATLDVVRCCLTQTVSLARKIGLEYTEKHLNAACALSGYLFGGSGYQEIHECINEECNFLASIRDELKPKEVVT